MTEGSTWTSLEVAKLVVGALTPIAVAFLTFAITRATDRADQARKEEADRGRAGGEGSRQAGRAGGMGKSKGSRAVTGVAREDGSAHE